jgi:hypothetical protein
MNLSAADYQSIRRWMYRNARPLDLARWQFHFENGSQADVLLALRAYQNEDGGFGHALEPDSWNPNSSPITTLSAINILEEIKFRDANHALVKNILGYLGSTPEFNGEHWSAIISSNKDYPHAPWWTDQTYDWGYNPTAALAGFILYHAGKDEPLYRQAKSIARAAVDRYLSGTMPDGQPYPRVRREGEIHCLATLLDFIEELDIRHEFNTAGTRTVLKQAAETFIEKDDSKWNEYCWKPSVFVKSPDSMFYPGNEKAIDTEMGYILNKRSPEGVWDINWSWGAYDKEFAISANWWKASLIIENLLMLRAFGKLDQPH